MPPEVPTIPRLPLVMVCPSDCDWDHNRSEGIAPCDHINRFIKRGIINRSACMGNSVAIGIVLYVFMLSINIFKLGHSVGSCVAITIDITSHIRTIGDVAQCIIGNDVGKCIETTATTWLEVKRLHIINKLFH